MTVLALDHIQLAIPKGAEDRARAFWQLLGFTEIPKPAPLLSRGGAWFRAGPVELHLGVEEPFSAARKAHPAFVVDDLGALTAQLLAVGVAVRPDTSPPDRARAFIDDPFGNRIELIDRAPRLI